MKIYANKVRATVVFLLLGIPSLLWAQSKSTMGGEAAAVWSIQKAQAWYAGLPWLTGVNYIPANAINQLEMWQEATFDSAQIDKELGWLADLGFNTVRVYLHSLAWKQDKRGFKERINQFLDIAQKHHVKTVLVFFDDCWNPVPFVGVQPSPRQGVHNSGWLQDPGDPFHQDEALIPFLKEYVQDILGVYSHDERILFWDLYNEPGGNGPGGAYRPKGESSFPLLKKVFSWAREINPSQPITSGIWNWNLYEMNAFVAANSDIITYHDYTDEVSHGQYIKALKVLGRPIICTEYMSRTRNSRFGNIMPLLKKENVGAINWGFVSGKTNTIYEWGKVEEQEPKLWFHDILRQDGTPYDTVETNIIKKLNNGSQGEVLRLAPGRNNPRNSEGDFVTLKDGRIMFVYSRYTGTSDSDHGTAELAARYSSDQGKSWTTHDQIIVTQEGKMNVMSVSLLRLQDGRIALFYLKKNAITDCIPMVRYSSDEGATWAEPIQIITDKKGYFVLNNDRVIQLANGRLIMAVALHHTPEGKWLDKADLYAYYSDDTGKTWRSSSKVPNNTDIITQEPGLIELRDSRLLMYIRASQGKQQFSYSKDKGQSWSHIEPSTIQSPLSPATIARIPKTGELLLVWNNKSGDERRTPLTAAISKDEGKTWRYIKNIENDPDGWYCYTAIHFLGDEVLLAYCAGSQSKKTHLNVIDIKKIKLDWFYE